jgi:predicted DNA-binding transcriptional regulator AlpA
MPARDQVKDCVTDFIARLSRGEAKNPAEYEVFPKILGCYLEHYGSAQSRGKRVEHTGQPEAKEEPETARQTEFPAEGYVTAEQVARFLGCGDFKHPAGVVRRMANEGKIPPPIHSGNRAFKWLAQDIRRYADSLAGDRTAA